jgi:hypothetical protein
MFIKVITLPWKQFDVLATFVIIVNVHVLLDNKDTTYDKRQQVKRQT